MLDNTTASALPSSTLDPLTPLENGATQKRKRKPAGTPGKKNKAITNIINTLFFFLLNSIDF